MSNRWTLTAALAALALGAAFIAVRLVPVAAPPPAQGAVIADDPAPAEATAARDIDIVLCLDTSSSMDDLIDSARARLWDVVLEVGRVEPNANLRVGLLSYGTQAPGGESTGFVVLQRPLSDDLDALYASMWGLSTNGGDEYVGWVLDDALSRMYWSEAPNAAHLIFVAGNESAQQGPSDAIAIARQARERGFRVNTLYAGDAMRGRREHWHSVADAGGGRFTAISVEDGLAQIETPHDREIETLNDALNETYVPYGAQGAHGRASQLAQDQNARTLGVGSASTRALTKGSGMYKNATWDLVDAMDQGQVDLEAMDAAALPAQMQGLAPEARRAYVEGQKARRDEIQRRMVDVQRQREGWLREHAEEGDGLGAAMKEMVDAQL